jgi:hypothetical protein
MRHPFGGIEPAQKPADQPEISTPSRRSLFGLVAGALAAGTFGLIAFGTKDAEAQRQVTTLATGEEGGRPRPGRPGGPVTRARFEQGTNRGWKK